MTGPRIVESGPLLNPRAKLIALTVFSFFMTIFLTFVINPYDEWWKTYFERPFFVVLLDMVIHLFFCTLISVASLWIHRELNARLSWVDGPWLRLCTEAILNIVSVNAIIFVLMYIMVLLGEVDPERVPTRDEVLAYLQWNVVSTLVALLISGIHTVDYLINNWKNTALESSQHALQAAEHKQAAAEAELQALKLQLDPHFVFNNLSVLSELILEDQQLGFQYSENFAKVYRYLLVNSTKDLVPLEEELKFVNAYIFLLQQRSGEGVKFDINLQPAHSGGWLPPLTLQLLIENALKHNKMLKSSPLCISISKNDSFVLEIANNLEPLELKEKSSGLGLNNIIQRYRLLSDREPSIQKTETHFKVTIPLISHAYANPNR